MARRELRVRLQPLSLRREGPGLDAVASRLLAQRLGPKTIAVAVGCFAPETHIPAARVFLSHAAQIGPQLLVIGNPQSALLEIPAQTEREFFFYGRGESHRLDLPAKALLGALGQLRPEAGLIDTRAL